MTQHYTISAFHKGSGLVSTAIKLATFGDVSHVENLCLLDGKSYSSTMQNGDGGCRGKRIKYSHPDRWVFVKMPVQHPVRMLHWQWGQVQKNKGYDYLGCASMAWIRYRQNPDKWFCSEFCRRAYVIDGTLPTLRKSRPLNPSQFKKELLKNGGTIVEFDERWLYP